MRSAGCLPHRSQHMPAAPLKHPRTPALAAARQHALVPGPVWQSLKPPWSVMLSRAVSMTPSWNATLSQGLTWVKFQCQACSPYMALPPLTRLNFANSHGTKSHLCRKVSICRAGKSPSVGHPPGLAGSRRPSTHHTGRTQHQAGRGAVRGCTSRRKTGRRHRRRKPLRRRPAAPAAL